MKQKLIYIPLLAVFAFIGVGMSVYHLGFSAPEKTTEYNLFVIPASGLTRIDLAEKLKEGGYVRSRAIMSLLLSRADFEVASGGYMLSKGMNVRQVVNVLKLGPEMKWVVIPEGWRKEQIGERLAAVLGWDNQALYDWTYTYTAMDYDHLEGVYFPDTYLIPVDENGLDVANRFRRRFDEVFGPYVDKFYQKDIKWTTALKLASIIQREAAGKDDMPLIAGILWNRLMINMKLEVDATVQYARDDRDGLTNGFWKPIKPEDKEIDSKYNTYMYAGLPPFPIANPGLDAIEAVLNPQETEYLFYLHDADGVIHGAKTYQDHLANIDKYLR